LIENKIWKDDDMLVKNLIKTIRVICNLTQCEFAKIADLDQNSVSYYERGKRKPGLSAKVKIVNCANTYAKMNINVNDIDD